MEWSLKGLPKQLVPRSMLLNQCLPNPRWQRVALCIRLGSVCIKPAPPIQPGNDRSHYRIQPLIQRLLRMEAVTRAGKKNSYVRLLRYSKAHNHDVYSDSRDQFKSNLEENISSLSGDRASSGEYFVIVPTTDSSVFFSCVNRAASLSALPLHPAFSITNLSSYEWHHPSPSLSHYSIAPHNRQPDSHLVVVPN